MRIRIAGSDERATEATKERRRPKDKMWKKTEKEPRERDVRENEDSEISFLTVLVCFTTTTNRKLLEK